MNIKEYFNITFTQGHFLKTKIKATDAFVHIRQIIVMEGDFSYNTKCNNYKTCF